MMYSLERFKKIVVLTGAGISAESGISTFRDSNGLWENHKIEDVATPRAFEKDPQLVWKFYSMRRIQAAQAKPNAAHMSLVDFAKRNQGRLTLITQNVDVLHERADAGNYLKTFGMHGELNRSRCTKCSCIYYDDYAYFNLQGDYAPQESHLLSAGERASHECLHQYSLEYRDFLPLSPCCKEPIRPHIVWFGEMPLHMPEIITAINGCDLFVSIGTSGVVYPAAGFLEMAHSKGIPTLCINKEPIPHAQFIDTFIQGLATEIVPKIFD